MPRVEDKRQQIAALKEELMETREDNVGMKAKLRTLTSRINDSHVMKIWLRLLCCVLLAVGFIMQLNAEESPQLDQAVAKGLAGLVKLQADNGSLARIRGLPPRWHGPARWWTYAHQRSIPRSQRQGIKALARLADAVWLFGLGGGNMYAHGFSTLYLAECYGMSPSRVASCLRGGPRANSLAKRSRWMALPARARGRYFGDHYPDNGDSCGIYRALVANGPNE